MAGCTEMVRYKGILGSSYLKLGIRQKVRICEVSFLNSWLVEMKKPKYTLVKFAFVHPSWYVSNPSLVLANDSFQDDKSLLRSLTDNIMNQIYHTLLDPASSLNFCNYAKDIVAWNRHAYRWQLWEHVKTWYSAFGSRFLKCLHGNPAIDLDLVKTAWNYHFTISVRVFSAWPCSSYLSQLLILAPWTRFLSVCSLWISGKVKSLQL